MGNLQACSPRWTLFLRVLLHRLQLERLLLRATLRLKAGHLVGLFLLDLWGYWCCVCFEEGSNVEGFTLHVELRLDLALEVDFLRFVLKLDWALGIS